MAMKTYRNITGKKESERKYKNKGNDAREETKRNETKREEKEKCCTEQNDELAEWDGKKR
jgi:hypothetical protein